MDEKEKKRQKLISRFVFLGFGLSGAAALIYEVVWTRSLSTIMGSSTYAVSTMLAAFMAGLSVGGWLGAILIPKIKRISLAFAYCELGIGLAGIIVMPVILALTPLYMKSFYTFHLSFNTFSIVQFIIVFMIMGIPTTLMGMTFPFVVKLFAKEGSDAGQQAGFLYGINTLGAIVGSTAAGFLLIPTLGVKGAALIAASLNIFTAGIIIILSKDFKKIIPVVTALLVLVPVSTIVAKQDFPFFSYFNAFRFGDYDMAYKVYEHLEKHGEKNVVYHNEGIDGDVALIKYQVHNNEYEWALTNNGKREAGDDRGFAMLAYLPTLHYSYGQPQSVLNIGLGSGNTLKYLAQYPINHIDSVELSEGIIEVNRTVLNPSLFSDPRIDHIKADGRNYLLLSPISYDVIIASPSWAVESASAGLLTDEFFRIAEKRLTPTGVFAVWVDFFMMSRDDLEIVVRTFSRHFNHSLAWYVEGDFVILVGSNTPFITLPDRIVQQVVQKRPDLNRSFRLLMSEEYINTIASGKINTDDKPVIEFHNARHMITWQPDEKS
ncbi:MAG: fused MFS/spermidine synthase [Proteobacteria bacterium]|nr:fused MFS/spermidine synthase [Pseudomonadota bacterium]MBU1708729.1 fused MFS/spermidine synthase [Pseudomonadota bacterium]